MYIYMGRILMSMWSLDSQAKVKREDHAKMEELELRLHQSPGPCLKLLLKVGAPKTTKKHKGPTK